MLFLGNSGDFAENAPETIELRSLKLKRLGTHSQPYHRLGMDQPEEETAFILADPEVPDTIRGYRMQASCLWPRDLSNWLVPG